MLTKSPDPPSSCFSCCRLGLQNIMRSQQPDTRQALSPQEVEALPMFMGFAWVLSEL